MADAKKCDRCGNYYQEREMNAIESLAKIVGETYYPNAYGAVRAIERVVDLCPGCSKSLRQWLSMKEGAEDGKL